MFQQLEAIFGRAPPDEGHAFNRGQECHVKADAPPGAPASSLARRLVGLMADKGKGLEQICAYLILTAQPGGRYRGLCGLGLASQQGDAAL
jgi:hypothetical protein